MINYLYAEKNWQSQLNDLILDPLELLSQLELDPNQYDRLAKMAQQQYRQALVDGVTQIGTILDQFYANKIEDKADELSNSPIMLN